MKSFLTALAITSTLTLTQGCASQVKSGEILDTNPTSISNANPHAGHNMEDSKKPKEKDNPHDGHNMGDSHDEHSGHSQLEPANATVKLTLPSKITPNAPVPMAIEIKDKNGKAIANFDKFQEELMHLIVVSDDSKYRTKVVGIAKSRVRWTQMDLVPNGANNQDRGEIDF
ncbi:hypothetical protein NIES4101_34370 [Calothrix sp. NIES-4101]|nr:hypothetical protein NIES4101_34370 [Calothrix sp. NIES-4101]